MSESTGVMEESAPLEELAGLPAQTTVAEASQATRASTTSATRSASITSRRLPDGWTMDQREMVWCRVACKAR